MKATAVIVPTQLAYASIPANELRLFVDGLFPKLAHSPIADIASGYGHRYVAGHDLLIDVPSTVARRGFGEGIKHAGHIILTDFPTKAGIPIPGFSRSGIGNLLEQAGIHRGWFQLNFCDAGLGVLAIAEGSSDLLYAINGDLPMNAWTFFDTFVEGGFELSIGLAFKNPLLVFGGLENILAGIVSTWQTYAIYIDPFVFFGSAATSAIIGFAVSYGLIRSSLSKAIINGIRSGIIGALFTVSPAFGFGALAGFIIYTLGNKLADNHQSSLQMLLSINDASYQQLVNELSYGNYQVQDLIESATPKITFLNQPEILASECENFKWNTITLSDAPQSIAACYQMTLSDLPSTFALDLLQTECNQVIFSDLPSTFALDLLPKNETVQ